MCESMLGMLSLTCEIDKRKLLFFGKVCKLDCNYLTKGIFLTRLHDFIQKNGKQFSGLIKDLYKILNQYSLLHHLQLLIEKGQFPYKTTWKTLVKRTIHQYHTEKWRERTASDSDFRIFRIFHSSITPIKIWKFSYAFDDIPFIKFLAKLWTIPSTFRTETCVLCQNMYTNQFQHAVLGCPCTRHIRFSDWYLWCSFIHWIISAGRGSIVLRFIRRRATNQNFWWKRTKKICLPLCENYLWCSSTL